MYRYKVVVILVSIGMRCSGYLIEQRRKSEALLDADGRAGQRAVEPAEQRHNGRSELILRRPVGSLLELVR